MKITEKEKAFIDLNRPIGIIKLSQHYAIEIYAIVGDYAYTGFKNYFNNCVSRLDKNKLYTRKDGSKFFKKSNGEKIKIYNVNDFNIKEK